MTGHRPFGKICYESSAERKLEKGKCKVWHTMYEGIIEDLIAQHDF